MTKAFRDLWRRYLSCVTHEDWLSFRKCLHKFTLLKRITGTIPSGQNITSCHCIHPHSLLSHSTGLRWKDFVPPPHVCNQRLYNAFCLGLTIRFDSFLTAIFVIVPLAESTRVVRLGRWMRPEQRRRAGLRRRPTYQIVHVGPGKHVGLHVGVLVKERVQK